MIRLNRNGYREFQKGKLSFRREFIKEHSKEGFDKVYFENEFLGYGYLNFKDEFPLRIYSFEIEDFEEALRENLREAYKIREKMGYSDVGRIVFSDSDFLPGLIFDKYNNIGVVSIRSPLYYEFFEILIEELRKYVKNLYEKSKAFNKFRKIFGENFRTEIEELDLKFVVDVEKGQKTGFYLDQRENRIKFRKFLREVDADTVLDAFCYSGAFGLHALKEGLEVSFLEKDEVALELLKENLKLNNLNGEIIEGDFFKISKNLEEFDIVLADPPNYSETVKVNTAYKNYYLIAYYCLKIVKKYFIYSICDPNVDVYNLIAIVQKASRRTGKKVNILDITFQSKDHRVSHPSLLYLKTIWVEIL